MALRPLLLALLLAGLAGCAGSVGDRPAPEQLATRATGQPSHATAQGRLPARGPVSLRWLVYDVVDGDTVKVVKGDRRLTLRLIGIDTPETVAPGQPVECFGPAASQFAEHRLGGRRVAVELDPTQGRLDYYGRTLAYVWVTPPTGDWWMFNRRVVRLGYGIEYTYDDPYLWQPEFQRAERQARAELRGLWSPSACG